MGFDPSHDLGLKNIFNMIDRALIHPLALDSCTPTAIPLSSLLQVRNPATGAAIGCFSKYNDSFLLSSMSDITLRGKTAQHTWFYEVFEQEKENVFRAIIEQFERYRGVLAKTMILEGGKLWRWAEAEVQETIDTLWHYHGEVSRVHTHDGFVRCQLPDKNAFSVRKPYGLILGITPWNFPLAVPMWKICGALAGGNAIVIKDAEQTPFTLTIAVELINRAIREALGSKLAEKLANLVQLIHGDGVIGAYLVENLDYDKVAFTGSAEVGATVASIAAKRLKPGHLELGGHAAMVVLDDFDIDLAVAEAINANLGDSGQRCVSTRVVFVQESRFDEFVEKYIERAKARSLGDPVDFKTEMGPLVSKEQLLRVHDQVMKTTSKLGRTPEIGGLLKEGGGYYYPPTVFTNVPYGVTAMDEEVFGPVIVINALPGKTREEAFWNGVKLVNQAKQGLSNALLTNDRRLASRAPWHFHTGLLYIGRGTTGAELNKYFGGVKASGWGREGKGLDDWTIITQVYDDYHGKARMAQAGADERVKEVISNAHSPLE